MEAIAEIFTEQKDWSLTQSVEKIFSSDDVIDAYLQGKKDGVKESNRLQVSKLSSNINKSGEYMSKIFATFKNHDIEPIDGFLKVNNWESFDMLIVVSDSDYLSEKILNMYNFIGDFEEIVKGEFYNLSISIVGGAEAIDLDCISSDGYIFKYNLSAN